MANSEILSKDIKEQRGPGIQPNVKADLVHVRPWVQSSGPLQKEGREGYECMLIGLVNYFAFFLKSYLGFLYACRSCTSKFSRKEGKGKAVTDKVFQS